MGWDDPFTFFVAKGVQCRLMVVRCKIVSREVLELLIEEAQSPNKIDKV